MTEREQFEAWAKKAGWPHHFTSCNTKDPNAYSQESWEVWQAARAQAAQEGPVLAESELRSILQGTNHMVKNAMHGAFWPELEEACRAVEQAVRAKMGVAGWQPIVTAPKDGTEILLSNGEVVAQGNWLHAEPYIKERRDIDGRYVDQDEFDGYDGWIDHAGGMQPDPTHWMPLPPPPGIVGKEGA